MIVAVDFDNTLTLPSSFPITGEIRKDAIKYIKKMRDDGILLILWTCRVDKYLIEAIDKLTNVGIMDCFVKVNDNISGNSRKVYADFYIDDKSMKINWKKIYRKVSSINKYKR